MLYQNSEINQSKSFFAKKNYLFMIFTENAFTYKRFFDVKIFSQQQ